MKATKKRRDNVGVFVITGPAPREELWDEMLAHIKAGGMDIEQAKAVIADDSLAEEFVSYATGKGVVV
jgi:hypothetical protein